MKKSYEDIINMDRPVSLKHKKMSNYDRAAQFSPFAALTGYEDRVSESGRIVNSKIELTEDEKSRIDMTLSGLEAGDMIRVEYFEPDKTKNGGKYVEFIGEFRKVDTIAREIEFADKSKISLDSLKDIYLDL